jgi:hypothetical protein
LKPIKPQLGNELERCVNDRKGFANQRDDGCLWSAATRNPPETLQSNFRERDETNQTFYQLAQERMLRSQHSLANRNRKFTIPTTAEVKIIRTAALVLT